jgi:hypothetical protein
MKKLKLLKIGSALLLIVLLSFFSRCVGPVDPPDPNVTVTGTCTNGFLWFNGSKLNSGLYGKRFLTEILKDCAPGTRVTLSLAANQYANRFEVRNSSGAIPFVTVSPSVPSQPTSINPLSDNWLGAPSECTLYSNSPTNVMQNSQSTSTVTFNIPSTGSAGIYLQVETCVPIGYYDSWTAGISCCNAVIPCTYNSCNNFFSGTADKTGYKSYNNIIIPLATINDNTLIEFEFKSNGFPNTFTIQYVNDQGSPANYSINRSKTMSCTEITNTRPVWEGQFGEELPGASPVTGTTSERILIRRVAGFNQATLKVTGMADSNHYDSWEVNMSCVGCCNNNNLGQ